MRIAVSSDLAEPVARFTVDELRRRGHEVSVFGALRDGDPEGAGRADWAWSARAAAREVAEGRVEQAVVCCWTGTGASIAANKVPGIRAALCTDAYTADGARRWNDANVLALGLRLTSAPLLREILDAWFAGAPSDADDDLANIAHLGRSERDA
jgi:RpiB/LacA/LacB family sugar-phosphate isomerase